MRPTPPRNDANHLFLARRFEEINVIGNMILRGSVVFLLALGVLTRASAAASDLPVRGADELFWVPTLEQGLAMSAATGKPLFLMGYSLVGDGSTYTKLGPTYCRGVF